jgi:hypothetical protein
MLSEVADVLAQVILLDGIKPFSQPEVPLGVVKVNVWWGTEERLEALNTINATNLSVKLLLIYNYLRSV